MGSVDSSSELPDPPPREVWEQPWFVLPATVAVDLLVIRTDQAAVTIGPIRAYPTGFEFTIDAHMRRAVDMRQLVDRGTGSRPRSVDTGPRALRVDLVYADGRRGDSTARWPEPGDDVAPGGLVMAGGGAVGSQYSWRSWYWVYPLPPPGAVAFHIAWPAYDIPETRVEIEGGLIREAAAHAIPIWPSGREGQPLPATTPEL